MEAGPLINRERYVFAFKAWNYEGNVFSNLSLAETEVINLEHLYEASPTPENLDSLEKAKDKTYLSLLITRGDILEATVGREVAQGGRSQHQIFECSSPERES